MAGFVNPCLVPPDTPVSCRFQPLLQASSRFTTVSRRFNPFQGVSPCLPMALPLLLLAPISLHPSAPSLLSLLPSALRPTPPFSSRRARPTAMGGSPPPPLRDELEETTKKYGLEAGLFSALKKGKAAESDEERGQAMVKAGDLLKRWEPPYLLQCIASCGFLSQPLHDACLRWSHLQPLPSAASQSSTSPVHTPSPLCKLFVLLALTPSFNEVSFYLPWLRSL